MCLVVLWMAYSVLGGVWNAAAQPAEPAVPIDDALEAAVAAWEAGDRSAARSQLATAYAADSAFVSAEHGAVAYWLGRALWETESPAPALEVWRNGLVAMVAEGVFDLVLADAYVRAAYETAQSEHYASAAQAYLWLLQSLDLGLDTDDRALVVRHLEPLAWILPPSLLAQTGLEAHGGYGKPSRTEPPPPNPALGAGAALTAWWRGQDALPATPQNERLQEHLHRVAHAEAHYRDDDGVFDDRARVYVRLGEPFKQTQVRFNSTEFLNKVVFRNLTVSSFDFPENEFWVYPHVDHAAHFLFVEDLGKYWLGAPNDLLPPQLQNGLSNSERGIRRSEALVRTMEAVYQELSLLHDDFAVRYQDVADYAELFDQQEIQAQAELEQQALQAGAELKDVGRDLSGVNVNAPVRTDLLPQLPHTFAMSMVARADYEDGVAAQRRAENVPTAFTELYRSTDPLPVVVRTARFLDADGTTRTELFWGIPPGGLEPDRLGRDAMRQAGFASPAPYLLSATIVQRDAAYQAQARHLNRHLVGSFVAGDDRALMQPQLYTLPGGTGTYHLAAQWDQQVVVLSGDRVAEVGPVVKREVVLLDSLQALQAGGEALEMSDLKPLLLEEDDGAPVIDAQMATPYPFRRVTNELPLALYFELYGLTFGADDRVHYTVEYEVEREQGGALRFLRRGGDETTSARTSYTASSRQTDELVLLDLAAWDGTGALQVTIRVTDETTGQQVERSLDFNLVEPS